MFFWDNFNPSDLLRGTNWGMLSPACSKTLDQCCFKTQFGWIRYSRYVCTPPLFKVSTVMLFPKKSKKQKKTPQGFFDSPSWVRGFPTSSAPPKMMNWRLLYDSNWPWAHQLLSQWSLAAPFGLFVPFLVDESISETHGRLPQRHQKTFFFGGGVHQNLGVIKVSFS